MGDDRDADLTPGELDLLVDAKTDDVSFDHVLSHLKLDGWCSAPDERPSQSEVDAAFRSLGRLSSRGLLDVGRMEYVDGGPPGRPAGVEHVPERLETARRRVEEAIERATRSTDWAFSCWVVGS